MNEILQDNFLISVSVIVGGERGLLSGAEVMASYLSAEIIRRLAVRHDTAPSLPDKLWDHRSLSLTKQTVRYTKSSHGLGFLHVDNVKGQNIFKS